MRQREPRGSLCAARRPWRRPCSMGARACGWRVGVATAMRDGRKVLRLPCDFTASNVERASWDRAVRLDLTSSRGIQFKVLCRNALPVSYFSIYFQSGEGWYHAAFFPESSTAWNTIEIDKPEMKSEGKPAGWGEIKTITPI